jgi:hypothetical protein
MTTDLAPRVAAPGQRLTYSDGAGALRRLEAEEIDGRWVIQPENAGDEAALKRHRMPIDEELAERQAAEREEADRLTGDALDRRAAELDIEGRSTMNADEKRAAIAAAEAPKQRPDDADADADQERSVNETTDQGDGAPSQED